MDSHDVHQLFWMVRMAEKCLTRDPDARLTMDKVSLHVPSLSTQNMCSLCVKTIALAFIYLISKGKYDSITSILAFILDIYILSAEAHADVIA